MTVSELMTAAKALNVDDRRRLLFELEDSLDEEAPPALSPEWMAEIHRRAAEMDAHPEIGIPWEQVRAELRAKIANHVDH